MQGDQIEVLVQQAAAGNVEAFTELILAFGRDLRLAIAAHAGAAAAIAPIEVAAWTAARQQLGQYRSEIPFADWLAGLASAPAARQLEDADRVAVYAKDALAHQIAQEGLAALEDGGELGVRELPGRVQALPEATRLLLVRHYREKQSVAAIATSQVVGESEIASALAGARAACDWRGIARPPAVGDRLLPALTADWLAGTIDPDSLGLLAANLARDLERGVQFSRQVRVHLALGVLLAPFGREEARAISRQVWGGSADSSRLLVGPPPAARAAPPVRPPGSDGRRAARKQSNALHPLADDDEVGRPSPLPWIIAGLLVLVGVGALAAMNLRGGRVVAPTVAPAAAGQQPGPAAPTADAGIGRIVAHTGDAGLVRQGSRLSATEGQPLHAGDGAVCVGPGARLSLALDPVGRIDLRGDSVLGAVGRKEGAWLAHLGSGRLVADVERPGTALMVLTPEARVEIAAAACMVTTGNGRTDIEVTRGSVRLVRPGDGTVVAVPAGRGAQLAERGMPMLTGGGVFVRGINLGGEPLAVERNPWLSQRQAEAAGLTIDAGATTAIAQVSSAGVDVEMRAMLGNGITAAGGTLRLVQVAADGEYEVTLWIAGGSADGLALRFGGQLVAVGRPGAGGDAWSRLGPYRVQARNRALEIAVGGLRGQQVAGLALAAVGPGEGALPPLVTLAGVAEGGHAYVGRAVELSAELSSSAGVARVEYWNGANRLGEAAAAPWKLAWTPPAAGALALTARALGATGGVSTSLPVAATAIPAFGAGALRREWWTGIDGLRIADAQKAPAAAAPPHGQADEVEFSARRDWGDQYLQRLRGYVVPPLDGDYVFWIAADDDGELWLSEDDTPTRKRCIALAPAVEGNGIHFQEWERDQRQRSEPLRLQAGRRYYVEVWHKEAAGLDHVEVGWRLPDGVLERPIPGVHLAPPVDAAPALAAAPMPAGAELRPDLMLWDGETRALGNGYAAGGIKAEPDAGRNGGVGVRAPVAVGFANLGWNWHVWHPEDGGTDLRPYQALSLWVRVDGARRPTSAKLGLVSSPRSAQRPSALVEIAKLVPDFADGKWHQVVVPLSAFAGPDYDPLKVWEVNLKLTGAGTLDCTLMLDEIGVLRALPGASAASPVATGELIRSLDLVSSGAAYVLAPATNRQRVYIDRDYQLDGLPVGFPAGQLIRTRNDDDSVKENPHLRFTLGAPADVHIAYATTATTTPAWMAGWKDSGVVVTAGKGGSYRLFHRTSAAGVVTLGGNERNTTGATSCYFVLVTPASVVPGPVVPAAPRFVAGINFGGESVVIDGNRWQGQKQAEEAAAAVPTGAQVVALSDLEWTAGRSANGDIHKNATWENKPLTLRGVVHPKGLGVHAESEIVYALGGRYSWFLCDVGIDDETGGRGSAVFRVFVDGQPVFDSGVVTHGSPAKKVNVPVSGGRELRLVVTDGGNGNDWDHADWASPRLLRAGAPGGLVVKAGRKTVSVMNPKPAVDAALRGMLTTSLVGTKEGLAFAVRVPPGSYQVYAWVTENSIANARLFELTLEGEVADEIGALPAGGWAKYGPFTVNVEDGELEVVAKAKKGTPQLMGLALFEPSPPAPPAIPAPAADDVLAAVPEAKDFLLVYRADLARLGVEVPYEVDDSAKLTGAFDRIGYCLELQRPGGQVEWVWTAMDAFTSEAGKIAIPTVASRASFHQRVANLTVAGNVKDLVSGAVGEGLIEFWPGDYGPANALNLPDASNEIFDFGDQRNGDGFGSGYGCMQVHNLAAKQTVFALNTWKEGANADLGIGNSGGTHRDWTFVHNANTYSLKRLRVFVRPKR